MNDIIHTTNILTRGECFFIGLGLGLVIWGMFSGK